MTAASRRAPGVILLGRLAMGVLGLSLLAGCSARQVTLTQRSGIEQQLLVRSLERSLAQLDTATLRGRPATLELFALTADERFAKQFVTARLEERGVRIATSSDDAEVALKVFATVLGVDRGETFFGLRAFQVPVAAVPIPEIPLFKWVRHRGLVEVQTYAYDARTGRFLDHLPDRRGQAKYDEFTILLLISFTITDLDKRPDPRAP